MCGIVGYLDKANATRPLGATVLRMLDALACRGPDSAGIALWCPGETGAWKLWISLGDPATAGADDVRRAQRRVLEAAAQLGSVGQSSVRGAYLRLESHSDQTPDGIRASIERSASGIEVISLGRQLELIKQVGSPAELDKTYDVSSMAATHGIGHTRLSTESRVDLSHSQPFWARRLPDVATVHNGHITNYHKLRRRYEQRGYRFYTENDSEIIGIYLHDQIERGRSLEEALHASVSDFDGSFCYLVGTGTTLAFVKDRFGLKPLVAAETGEFIAIATEEIALRRTLGEDFEVDEPPPGAVGVWHCQGMGVSSSIA